MSKYTLMYQESSSLLPNPTPNSSGRMKNHDHTICRGQNVAVTWLCETDHTKSGLTKRRAMSNETHNQEVS